jgi:hypothetical protein
MEYKKKFIILGNNNAVTYKEVFRHIKANKLWLGPSIYSGDREFRVPNDYVLRSKSQRTDEDGVRYVRVPSIRWFTNLNHKKRNEEIILYKKYNKKDYPTYDNYNAIEVSKVADIPVDYKGAMGVPITFLSKYNPKQFEILGCSYEYGKIKEHISGTQYATAINNRVTYKRLFIKRK